MCILIRKLVKLRIRFYSQELLFFTYDISLPDTDILYYRDIKTAWQILYFVLRNPFKTYVILTPFTTVNLHTFSYFKFSRKQDTTYCLPLYWFILLCLHVILLYLNVNFIVWMCISYTYLLISWLKPFSWRNKLYITWISSLFIDPTEQPGFIYNAHTFFYPSVCAAMFVKKS